MSTKQELATAKEKIARVEAWIVQWEKDAAERGPDDMLYTNGVVGILKDALADPEEEQA